MEIYMKEGESYLSMSGRIIEISASRGKKGREILIDTGKSAKKNKAIYFSCSDDYMWQLALVAVANNLKVLAHYDCEIVEEYENFNSCKLSALSIDIK